METRPRTSSVRKRETRNFMSLARSAPGELIQAPLVFADELLNDRLGAHLVGKDFPRVGFHLEMGAEFGLLREEIEQAEVVR